jgi:hypothetical protein
MAPSKVMSMMPGVDLIEGTKISKGSDLNLDGKFSIAEYRKLSNPKA